MLDQQLQPLFEKLAQLRASDGPQRGAHLRTALLRHLRDVFRAPAPEEEYSAYSYYAEVALLLRQLGSQGVSFLHQECARASTPQLRAILFALAESPKLRRAWLPQLWRSYLQDSRDEIVAEAIDSLWRYGDRKARFAVSQLHNHRSPFVRGSVLRYIGHVTPQFAPLFLIGALTDEDFIVRESAIDEIDRLEILEALPYLLPCQEDSSSQVREAARTAIDNLKQVADAGDFFQLRAG